MGTEKPTGEHPDKLANGVNGHSGNGTKMERSNSVQHFDGKGKDVIPLYRYGATPVQHGSFAGPISKFRLKPSPIYAYVFVG